MKRVLYLDVFRGLAALLVFFYHSDVNIRIAGTPIYGYVGVHLFFVLSGFLLSRYFVGTNRAFDLNDYVHKRFFRIYPAYAVCLTAFIALRFVTKTNIPEPGNIVAHYLLIFNYFSQYDFYSINPVLWSLTIEAQFYILLPIFFLVGGKLTKKTAVTVPLAMVAIGLMSRTIEFFYFSHITPSTGTHIRFTWVTSYLDMFAFGILLRSWEVQVAHWGAATKLKWINAMGMIIPLVGLWLISRWASSLVPPYGKGADSWLESPYFPFILSAPVLTCLCFASLLATTISNQKLQHFFNRLGPLAWVGMISYSLYLYHPGVYFFVWKVFKLDTSRNWTLMTTLNSLIALPIILVVAWASYKFVEEPCMNFKRRKKPEVPVTA